MPEKEIKEKIDKIIEGLLSAISVGIEGDHTTVRSWKIVHNNIKSLSTIIKIREKLGKIYPSKKQNIDLLLLTLLMNKMSPSGGINSRKKIENVIKELGYPDSLKGTQWEEFYNIFKSLEKDT